VNTLNPSGRLASSHRGQGERRVTGGGGGGPRYGRPPLIHSVCIMPHKPTRSAASAAADSSSHAEEALLHAVLVALEGMSPAARVSASTVRGQAVTQV
jgi:hypothetical protein